MSGTAMSRGAHASAFALGEPLVITRLIKSALRIVAMNDAAQALGLRPGMPLADARAMYPSLAVAESDEEADRRLIEAVADWCDRYTPLVGIDAPDGLVLDIAGCAHLFGGEAAMCDDILARLADQGLHARAAIADTVGCAFAVARFCGASPMNVGLCRNNAANSSPPPCGEGLGMGVLGGGIASPQLLDPPPRPSPTRGEGIAEVQPQFNLTRMGMFLVPRGGMRHALAPLTVAALRLEPEIIEALAGLGLRRIADVIDLPRAPLAARFGEILVRRLDQALGREDEPITPRLPVPSYVAEQSFPDPIVFERDVLGTIARLAAQLGTAMERRQEGARLLQVALFRTDNKVYRIEVGTGAPVRNAARIAHLFADRLTMIGDDCDPGFGFDMMRLAALVTERSDPVQSGLSQSQGMRDGFLQDGFGCPDDDAAFSHLIDRLGARFGPHRVTRLVEQDTHIPEFAVASLPAHAVGTQFIPPPLAQSSRMWFSSSPSPRLPSGRLRPSEPVIGPAEGGTRWTGHGEGRGEGASPQARIRGEPSSPAPTLPSPASGGGKGGGDLSSQAGRGKNRGQMRSPGPRGGEEKFASRLQDSLSPTRPVRLFGRPEPVEVVAEVPDGPPARFRWRRVLHEVATVEGPERIAMEWWRDANGQALTRDYFRVESREGLRVWLYREGLYGDAIPVPRWFLHGLFG
jgi:protein ImuB